MFCVVGFFRGDLSNPKKHPFLNMLAFRPARRFLPFILCCVLSSARPQGNAALHRHHFQKIQLNQVNVNLSYRKDQVFQAVWLILWNPHDFKLGRGDHTCMVSRYKSVDSINEALLILKGITVTMNTRFPVKIVSVIYCIPFSFN